jgi:hypothetical protein
MAGAPAAELEFAAGAQSYSSGILGILGFRGHGRT